ncbi:MAG: ribosome biogenesis GTPase Der [Lautropia sp.]
MNDAADGAAPIPVIALVGRPNVGKSTLFNRLTGRRDALVADVPGLTRDRHYGRCQLGDRRFVLIDTGGFEPVAASGVAAQMARQTRQAIIEADLVLFLVDGRQGLMPRDREIADELRRAAPLVRVAVNKSEGIGQPIAAAEFHALGLGEPYAIAAAHGDGVAAAIEDCLDAIDARRIARGEPPAPRVGDEAADAVDAQAGDDGGEAAGDDAAAGRSGKPGKPDTGKPGKSGTGKSGKRGEPVQRGTGKLDAAATGPASPPPRPIRVAIVGRPNSGKSTLINALLGEERLIAFDTPGTTRDAIRVDFRHGGRDYQLIDTAGIRRRGKVHEAIEKFSLVKTLQAIEDANVCVLLIDAVDGVSEQDAAIASYILDAGRALVVALNKWDALPADDRRAAELGFARKLYFLSWARMHPISALKKRALPQLMRSIAAAHAAATGKLSTPKLTRMLQAAVLHQAPPRHGPVRPKLRYAHQGGQNPPIIVIHGSALDHVGDSYKRYLEGWFRERLSLEGTPLRIELRSGANPFAAKTPR